MNLIRIVLIVALAVGLTLFAFANWTPVQVNIGFGLILQTWLPVLIAVSMLLVALPMWAVHKAQKLLLTRKLARVQSAYDRSEAALAQARIELLRPPATTAPPIAPTVPATTLSPEPPIP